MEKQLKSEPNSLDKMKDIYRQACLKLEAGDRVKLYRFNNFKVNWQQLEEEKTFEVFHDLDGGKILRYVCQLESPEEVNTLLNKIEQEEFSSETTAELLTQTVEILAVDIM